MTVSISMPTTAPKPTNIIFHELIVFKRALEEITKQYCSALMQSYRDSIIREFTVV